MNFQPSYWVYNQSPQTFNTLNSFVLRGDAPPRMELTFDTLMSAADDEPNSYYGLVAETVDVSDDGNVFTFHLRAGRALPRRLAAHRRGRRLLADAAQGEGPPGHLAGDPADGDGGGDATPRTVTVTLDGKQTRADDPHHRRPADLLQGLLRRPAVRFLVARRAARLRRLQGRRRCRAGRFIEYERVPDYWGKDLPVNVGHGNFDVIRIDFFQEREAAFQAFQKGAHHLSRGVHLAHLGDRLRLPGGRPRARSRRRCFRPRPCLDFQCFFFNTRRAKFADPRTRLAIGLAFDFEWTNKNLFFDAYDARVLLFPELGLHGRRQAGRGRAEAARALSRPTCRRRCSARPMCRRRPTARATTAPC